MKNIHGFGGAKVYNENGDAKFYGDYSDISFSNNTLSYKPIYIRVENIYRTFIQKFLGYRIEMDIEILNFRENDYIEIKNLFQLLSQNHREGVELSMMINTNDGTDGINIEDILLSSSIEMIQTSQKLAIGQTLSLKFYKRKLVQDISHYIDNLDPSNLNFNNINANFNAENAVVK